MKFQTTAIHHGVYTDKTHNSVTTPIYPSSTYMFEEVGELPKFDYGRTGNPTRAALEENLAALEGGVGATVHGTGMASVLTAIMMLKPGDHIITGHDIYGGTWRLFAGILEPMGWQFSYVNMGDPANVRAAIRPNTKALWVETPSNPLLNLVDIRAMADIAKDFGLITYVDNTFMSPCLQRPFELGADIIIHSTTKYINGHSDVVAGAVICADEEHAERISFLTKSLGTNGNPFDSWLVLRGLKTLGIRMEHHCRNAQAIAEFLDAHPRVKRVYYPGLASHPHHELAKRQMKGMGGMLSFDLDLAQLDMNTFCQRLKVFRLAESLGGVTSLVEQPWTMSHASMDEHARIEAGITEATLRVSVGLEDPEDLVEDFRQALEG
jgi:cystathionine gamma-synthase